MALPDSEKVIQELNRRFAQPLPEFYSRRIIFWYDEDREFEDKISEIELVDAKVVAMTGTNSFEIKKLLSHDDKSSNYLLYCPINYPDLENWLLPIQLYSEEFRADLTAIWMDEMGIPSTVALRSQVKKYSKFLNARSRREDVVKHITDIDTP